MTQELFNSLMAALHHPLTTVHYLHDGDTTDYDAIRSLSDMYPDLRRVWWEDNSWKFNGFPE